MPPAPSPTGSSGGARTPPNRGRGLAGEVFPAKRVSNAAGGRARPRSASPPAVDEAPDAGHCYGMGPLLCAPFEASLLAAYDRPPPMVGPKGERRKKELALHLLRPAISTVFHQKLVADEEALASRQPRMRMDAFVIHNTLGQCDQRYLNEGHTQIVVLVDAVKRHYKSEPRVALFARLVGLHPDFPGVDETLCDAFMALLLRACHTPEVTHSLGTNATRKRVAVRVAEEAERMFGDYMICTAPLHLELSALNLALRHAEEWSFEADDVLKRCDALAVPVWPASSLVELFTRVNRTETERDAPVLANRAKVIATVMRAGKMLRQKRLHQGQSSSQRAAKDRLRAAVLAHRATRNRSASPPPPATPETPATPHTKRVLKRFPRPVTVNPKRARPPTTPISVPPASPPPVSASPPAPAPAAAQGPALAAAVAFATAAAAKAKAGKKSPKRSPRRPRPATETGETKGGEAGEKKAGEEEEEEEEKEKEKEKAKPVSHLGRNRRASNLRRRLSVGNTASGMAPMYLSTGLDPEMWVLDTTQCDHTKVVDLDQFFWESMDVWAKERARCHAALRVAETLEQGRLQREAEERERYDESTSVLLSKREKQQLKAVYERYPRASHEPDWSRFTFRDHRTRRELQEHLDLYRSKMEALKQRKWNYELWDWDPLWEWTALEIVDDKLPPLKARREQEEKEKEEEEKAKKEPPGLKRAESMAPSAAKAAAALFGKVSSIPKGTSTSRSGADAPSMLGLMKGKSFAKGKAAKMRALREQREAEELDRVEKAGPDTDRRDQIDPVLEEDSDGDIDDPQTPEGGWPEEVEQALRVAAERIEEAARKQQEEAEAAEAAELAATMFAMGLSQDRPRATSPKRASALSPKPLGSPKGSRPLTATQRVREEARPKLEPMLVPRPPSCPAKPSSEVATLDFSYYQMANETAVRLAGELPGATRPGVECLLLRDNAITADGCVRVVQHLRRVKTLTELDLADNAVGVEGAEALGALGGDNVCRLMMLDLSNNRLSDVALGGMLSGIQFCNTLSVLNLSHNHLGYGPATSHASLGRSLAEFLSTTRSLRVLDLSWNQMGEQAGQRLAASLADNVGLKLLDLRYNRLGGKTLLAMARAGVENSDLKTLDLSYNGVQLTRKEWKTVASELLQNDTLTLLQLNGNAIDAEGRETLMQLCEERKSVTVYALEVGLEDCDEEDREERSTRPQRVMQQSKSSYF